MAKVDIRNDFVEGMQEVFSTLFNDGTENDGIFLFLMSESTKGIDPYGENKNKKYKQPKLLIAKAVVTPTQGEQDVMGISNSAEFTVPIKSLIENGLEVSDKFINEVLLKSVIRFKGVYYQVDLISPKAYVEDVFLFYAFSCSELKDFSMVVEEENSEETVISSFEELYER